MMTAADKNFHCIIKINMTDKKKTVLIAEDDMFVSNIYETKFVSEGFEVIMAENGKEAIQKLEMTVPDIILLDIVMPYVDGVEALRSIKRDPRLKSVPIIMLTNLSEKEKVEEVLSMGADDYLIKSHFTPTEVMDKVKQVLKMK